MNRGSRIKKPIFTAENFEIAEESEDADDNSKSQKSKDSKKLRKSELRSKIKEANSLECNHNSEMEKNCFSQWYRPNFPVKEEDLDELSPVERALKTYQHSDAIDFMASSIIWKTRAPPTEALVRSKILFGSFPVYSNQYGCRAYYRVISDKGDKYVLMACHLNVHGEHRGDLRFVEVNDRTATRGIKGSAIGNLFIGDIVAVTELAMTAAPPGKSFDVYSASPDGQCIWMVRNMTVLTRERAISVKFAVLNNGTAVVKGSSETMKVQKDESCPLDENSVYIGDVFIPTKISWDFTEDHHQSSAGALIAKATKIPSFPQASGTVYQYCISSEHSKMFDIGTEAFKSSNKSGEKGAEVVEFCALIGYSAANAVFSAHNDRRPFVMQNPSRCGLLVKFSIENPKSHPTDGLWHTNGRITIKGSRVMSNAMIETIISNGDHLKIVARLSRDAPHDIIYTPDKYIVRQRGGTEPSFIQEGFFENLDPASNGRRIIEALYGGKPIKFSGVKGKTQYIFPSSPPINLNEFQCEYVSMILEETPMVLGNSPFGCGKSMTIVTAALNVFEKFKRMGGRKEPQLLITQSNYASVNLVDIVLKTRDRVKDVKILRYMSDANWKGIQDQCRTELDMPNVMDDVFVKWATDLDASSYPSIMAGDMIKIVQYVVHTLHIPASRLNAQARIILSGAPKHRKIWPKHLTSAFFTLYHPDIIIVTANSLPGLTSFISLGSVSTVQIDEASQLPEYTLLGLLSMLRNSCFGLIGDIQQLPPYCEEELTGKLKDYGIGNAMERAVKMKMFPQAVLRCVYRCHPAVTGLLGEMFYDNELISGVTDKDRSDFMTTLPHFWPKSRFPIMVVDNKAKAQAMGTSFANSTERIVVQQIVSFLTDGSRKCAINPEDVGIISYYSAQTSLLTEVFRDRGVKCGTVDSFQGSEREIIILCCTNDDIQEFLQVKNRLNVAVSRAKQVTIIIGNVEMLKECEYWKTIVEKCSEKGTVMEANEYPFKADLSRPNLNKSTKTNKDVIKLAKRIENLVTLKSDAQGKQKK